MKTLNNLSGTPFGSSIDTVNSLTTNALTVSTPIILPQKSTYGICETSNAVTVTASNTVIEWNSPNYAAFNGGSNKLKFPYRGLYMIEAWISYDNGALSNFADFKLREDGGGESFFVRCYTGGSGQDSNPYLVCIPWTVLNLTDRVAIMGNRDPDGQNVTNVRLRSGVVYLIERFT